MSVDARLSGTSDASSVRIVVDQMNVGMLSTEAGIQIYKCQDEAVNAGWPAPSYRLPLNKAMQLGWAVKQLIGETQKARTIQTFELVHVIAETRPFCLFHLGNCEQWLLLIIILVQATQIRASSSYTRMWYHSAANGQPRTIFSGQ